MFDADIDAVQKRLGMGLSGMGDVVAAAEAAHLPLPEPAMSTEDEELWTKLVYIDSGVVHLSQ